MAPRMTQALFFTLIVTGMAVSACAQDEQPVGDDFVSSTVSAVFDKVNKYTSGEKSLFIKDYDKSDESSRDYSTDVLGRKIKEPVIRSSTKASLAKEDSPGNPAASDDKKSGQGPE